MEEEELRDSEALYKAKETGDIGMIICDILCLFSYIAYPLLLLSLELWGHPQIDYVVTSIGMDLHRIITEIGSGYCKF